MQTIPHLNQIILKQNNGLLIYIYEITDAEGLKLIKMMEVNDFKQFGPLLYDKERNLLFYGHTNGLITIDMTAHCIIAEFSCQGEVKSLKLTSGNAPQLYILTEEKVGENKYKNNIYCIDLTKDW